MLITFSAQSAKRSTTAAQVLSLLLQESVELLPEQAVLRCCSEGMTAIA
jgi:hypothetical protein